MQLCGCIVFIQCGWYLQPTIFYAHSKNGHYLYCKISNISPILTQIARSDSGWSMGLICWVKLHMNYAIHQHCARPKHFVRRANIVWREPKTRGQQFAGIPHLLHQEVLWLLAISAKPMFRGVLEALQSITQPTSITSRSVMPKNTMIPIILFLTVRNTAFSFYTGLHR